MKKNKADREQFEEHYDPLIHYKFLHDHLIEMVSPHPVTVMVFEGIDTIETTKKILDFVDPRRVDGAFKL